MIDIDKFKNWVEENPQKRTFKVSYSGWDVDREIKVLVIDNDHSACQYVTDVEQINLKAISLKTKREEYEKLKAELEANNEII